MTDTMKTIALIVCALILIAAVLICFTDVFRFTGYSYAEPEKYTAGGAEITSPVKNLDIGWVNGKVNLSYHSGNTVMISETSNQPISDDFRLRWALDGDTLFIRFAKTGFRMIGWNNQQKELTVTLPEGIALGDVSISATSADLSIPSLKAESLNLNTTSGNVTATADARKILGTSTSGDLLLTVSGDAREIRSTATSGKIRIEAAGAEQLRAVTTSGDIHLTAGTVGELQATSTSGTILADLETLAGGQFSSTSGSITVSAKALNTLNVNATSGSVLACLPSEPGFTASVKTASGSFDYSIPLTRNSSSRSEYVCGDGTGTVRIQTTSGNVRIDSVQ